VAVGLCQIKTVIWRNKLLEIVNILENRHSG